MQLECLDHVHFAVPDLQRAKAIYEPFLGGEFVPLQRLETLEAMLVEDDDEGHPHHAPDEDRHARDLEGGVGEDEAVRQHHQTDAELQEQPEARDAGGLLIGEMVGSHERRSGVTGGGVSGGRRQADEGAAERATVG